MKFINGFWVPDNDHNLVLDLLGPGGSHDVQVFTEVRRYTLDQPKRVMVDVGANIGRWAKHFYTDYHQVFCYEPAYYNLECLKKNTEHETNISSQSRNETVPFYSGILRLKFQTKKLFFMQ